MCLERSQFIIEKMIIMLSGARPRVDLCELAMFQ